MKRAAPGHRADSFPKLSPVMQGCLDKIRTWGGIERYAGGYWSRPGQQIEGRRPPPETWFGTQTVHALVDRELVEYTGTRRDRFNSEFPVRAQVK
jgi:hypothetical protein